MEKKISAAHKKLKVLIAAGEVNNVNCNVVEKCDIVSLERSAPSKENENEKEKENRNEADLWFLKKLGPTVIIQEQVKEAESKAKINVEKYKTVKQKIEENLSSKRHEEMERRYGFYNVDNEILSNRDDEEEEEEEFSDEESGEENDKEEERGNFCESNNVIENGCEDKHRFSKRKVINEEVDNDNASKRPKYADSDHENFGTDRHFVIDGSVNYSAMPREFAEYERQKQLTIAHNNANNNELSHITLDLDDGDEMSGSNATPSQDLDEALFLCSGTFDSNGKSTDSTDIVQKLQKQCTSTKLTKFPSMPTSNECGAEWDSSSVKSSSIDVPSDNVSSRSWSKPSNFSDSRTKTAKTQRFVISDSEDSNLSMNSYSRGATKMGPSKLVCETAKVDFSQHEKDFKSLHLEGSNKQDGDEDDNDTTLRSASELPTSLNAVNSSPSTRLEQLNENESNSRDSDFGFNKQSMLKKRILDDDVDEDDAVDESVIGDDMKEITANPLQNLFADDQLFTVDDDVEDNYADYNVVYDNGNSDDNSDSDENEDNDLNGGDVQQVKLKDILDDEASLSGDDVGSDEDDRDSEDEYELEEGDNDELPDEEEIRENLLKQYIKQSNDEEERRILRLQEQFFADSDLHGVKNMDRSFRFRMRDDLNVDWSKVLGKLNELDDGNKEEENVEGDVEETNEIKEKKIEMMKWKLEQEKKKGKFNNSGIECFEMFAQSSLLSLGEKSMSKEAFMQMSTSVLVQEENFPTVVQRDSLLKNAKNLKCIIREGTITEKSRTLFTSAKGGEEQNEI